MTDEQDLKQDPEEPKLMGATAFRSANVAGTDEQEFNIRDTEGVVKGYMLLHNIKQPVYDKYRDIRSGEGRRKGDVAEARRYMFKRCYGKMPNADGSANDRSGFRFAEKFAGWELDLRPYLNLASRREQEIGFWLGDPELESIVDAVLIAYFNHFFPDIDSKKS